MRFLPVILDDPSYVYATLGKEMISQVALEFSVDPAEAVVLMTVGYGIPLSPPEFIEHAAWESVEEFDVRQMRDAFDRCLLNRWICVTQNGIPEFTDVGQKLWSDIRSALRKRREEQNAIRAEETLRGEGHHRQEKLNQWREWSDAWKAELDRRLGEEADHS